ncbi:uncharacterized protein LOC112553450 [Pomacea canaliculata]|uniref:uncharacterized protein LOC112553450 n=1 Tax=Pomacea canaliculata TaxID=400727 RepID=UPI000D7313FC|nr:uncharacterized protein LOC112553450 [Pomacea canaliculata]
MMKYLSCIGGENVPALVRSILRRIFSTPLALQYNFTGVKGKKGFLALRVRGVMMDAVRRVFPQGTELEINNVARKWFIRDRDGGRHRRFISTTDSGSPSRLSGGASVREPIQGGSKS